MKKYMNSKEKFLAELKGITSYIKDEFAEFIMVSYEEGMAEGYSDPYAFIRDCVIVFEEIEKNEE